MQAVAAAIEEAEVVEETPSFCGVCSKSLDGEKWERCHVCRLPICPSCDIRGKQPEKPACSKHA